MAPSSGRSFAGFSDAGFTKEAVRRRYGRTGWLGSLVARVARAKKNPRVSSEEPRGEGHVGRDVTCAVASDATLLRHAQKGGFSVMQMELVGVY